MKRFLGSALCAFICAAPIASVAKTPNEVYQIVSTIDAELAALHRNNFSEPAAAKTETAKRLPRHVFEIALTVNRRIQTLRFINGLQPRAEAALPVRDITPADVAGLVGQILHDVRALRSVYGVSQDIEAAPTPSGKTPSDVFNKLLRVEASLMGLGVPRVVPNDVAQAAETVLGDLRLIERAQRVTAAPDGEATAGKSPADAYDAAYALLSGLADYAAQAQLPGGITLPTRKSGGIAPSDVLFLLAAASAEVGALKAHLGVREPTRVAPLRGGQTPSHVWTRIDEATGVVRGLQLSER